MKTERTAIKQELSPGLNRLDYAVWGVLENKTNATSEPNIGSLKIAVEEEWNKISKEYMTSESFRKCVDTMIEKMVAILIKVTVLYLSLFSCLFFKKLESILLYDRVVC